MTEPIGMRGASTSLPEPLYTEIEELARANDRTLSAQIRRMLKDWLANSGMDSQPMPEPVRPWEVTADPDGRSVTVVPEEAPHRGYSPWPPTR